MTELSARRVSFDDDAWEQESAPIQALTRPQAEALMRKRPSVSPWRVVLAQAVAGGVCVVVAYGATRSAAVAWSALYGAAAMVIPACLLVRGMSRPAPNAMAAAIGFMFWEVLKVGVSIAMLLIASSVVVNLSWPALLATMVVCMKVNWIALLWRARQPQDKA